MVRRFGAARIDKSPITACMILRNTWSLNMASTRLCFVHIVTNSRFEETSAEEPQDELVALYVV